MLTTSLLACTLLITQPEPATAAPAPGDEVTLIIVASPRWPESGREFLALTSKGNTINWKFLEAAGRSNDTLDPKGESWAKGTSAGSAAAIRAAFKAAQKKIGPVPILRSGEELPEDPTKRKPAAFSLLLIDQTGVESCELWGGDQRRELVHRSELKPFFDDARKKVYGIAISMPDLLKIGRDPDLADPDISETRGEEPPPRPKKLSAE